MRQKGGAKLGGGRRQAHPEFIAAIRYKNGDKDIFYVRNADDFADARTLLHADLMNVKTVLLALRTTLPEEKVLGS